VDAGDRGTASALARVAATLAEQDSVDHALEAVVSAVVQTVPGADLASISRLQRCGALLTLTASDERAVRIDEAQAESREGPCVDTLRQRSPMTVDNLADHHRWPRFAQRALALGVRGRMSFLLDSTHRSSAVALNVYSTSVDTFDPGARVVGQLFAAYAMLALRKVHAEQTLGEALRTRKAIGQAVGIVMERYQLTDERAFAFLVRVSSLSNRKLRDLALDVVDDAERHGLVAVAPPSRSASRSRFRSRSGSH